MAFESRKHILVRGTNWIGDAVMTMPAIHRLRELEPDAHLTMLCPAKLRDLWAHNPKLNELITFESVANIKQLRQQEYELAIVFPNSFRSAWECWRAHTRYRVGYAGRLRRFLLTDVVPEKFKEEAEYEEISVNGTTFRRKKF